MNLKSLFRSSVLRFHAIFTSARELQGSSMSHKGEKEMNTNNNKLLKHLSILGSVMVAAAMLLSACSLFAPVVPTPDPADQKATVDAAVAQALHALSVNLTSTAAALPTSTFTPEPTREPTSTFTPAATATLAATPTRTRVPYTAVPTATATPAAYTCKLVSHSPTDGTKLKLNEDFDGVWVVKNVGTKSWEIGSLDLKYVSGTKFQTKGDIFDVSTVVAPGAELTLVVDMKAPSTAGKYTALWMLTMDGTTAFCSLPLSIEAVTP